MSRVGKKPIPIPEGVKVNISDSEIHVKGPLGELTRQVPNSIGMELANGFIVLKRSSDERQIKSLHGLYRSLIANMVKGVKEGFERKLEIVGIGYRAQVQGKTLNLSLGYSQPIFFPVPDGIQIDVDKQILLTVKGIDKELVGEIAAKIRALRSPDSYKGKGVRYVDEYVRKKAGKAGAK